MTSEAPQEPVQAGVRVLRGSGDDSDVAVELAALLAVLAARSPAQTAPITLPSVWADRAVRLRQPFTVQAGGWRRSAFPM